MRIGLDVRRVWVCPKCGTTWKTAGKVVARRCSCEKPGVWMKLTEQRPSFDHFVRTPPASPERKPDAPDTPAETLARPQDAADTSSAKTSEAPAGQPDAEESATPVAGSPTQPEQSGREAPEQTSAADDKAKKQPGGKRTRKSRRKRNRGRRRKRSSGDGTS